MTDKDTEILRLREALRKSKKETQSLKRKLDTTQARLDKERKELKSLKKKLPAGPPTPEEMLKELLSMSQDIISRRH